MKRLACLIIVGLVLIGCSGATGGEDGAWFPVPPELAEELQKELQKELEKRRDEKKDEEVIVAPTPEPEKEEIALPAPAPLPTRNPKTVVVDSKYLSEHDCHLYSPPDKSRPFPGDVAGKGGTLYIGESETRYGIVILLRASYGSADKVSLVGAKAKTPLTRAGWANPEQHGSKKYCREHWRLQKPHSEIRKIVGQPPYRAEVDKHSFPVSKLEGRQQ